MFNLNKNKMSNKEIAAILDEHSNRLECLFEICKLQTNATELFGKAIKAIMEHFKFDSQKERESFFKKLDTICEDYDSTLEEKTDDIEEEMDTLCGFWRTSSLRADSIIMISKLPNKKYVFTYYPIGIQNDSYSFTIENIIDQFAFVIIMGNEMTICFESETEENQRTILFNNALYFSTLELYTETTHSLI